MPPWLVVTLANVAAITRLDTTAVFRRMPARLAYLYEHYHFLRQGYKCEPINWTAPSLVDIHKSVNP